MYMNNFRIKEMVTTFKALFDEESKDTVFDEKLAKKIKTYLGDLMNRNDAHIMFFGSNLTGPYPLRFKTSDSNEWFIDIMDVDERRIGKRIEKETGINPNWVRATDAFNMDCFYAMHRYMNSKLPDRIKHETIVNIAMILNIKLLGSIMARFFKYNVDERAAQEVYARLSRKFYIKRFGNWRRVLEHRSEDMASKTSKWYPVLKEFTDAGELAQCISDVQGRLRSMIKYVWSVFEKVQADQKKFNHTSMSIEVDGVKVLQELKRDSETYKHYIHKSAVDRPTFIKDELVTIVDAEMRTMPQKLLYDVLGGVVQNIHKHSEDTLKLFDHAIEFAVEVIQNDRTSKHNLSDLSWLINKVRLQVTAAKTKDPIVFSLRDEAEKIVRMYAKTKNPTTIASVRTGLILYIVIRAFSKRYYN